MEAPVLVGTEILSWLDCRSKMVLVLNPQKRGSRTESLPRKRFPKFRIHCFILCSTYLLLFFFLLLLVFLLTTFNQYHFIMLYFCFFFILINIHCDGPQRGSHACTVTAPACRALLSGMSLWKVCLSSAYIIFPINYFFFIRFFC